MKLCSKCEVGKPIEDFYRDKTHNDGRMSVCKSCKNQKRDQWFADNPEKRKEYRKSWKSANPNYHSQYNREWRSSRPLYMRIAGGRYRALQLGQCPDRFYAEDLIANWIDRGVSPTTCFYTGEPLGDEWHLDHMVPLSRGGQHAVENLVPCIASVNLDKKDKTSEEYLAEVQEVD